MATLIELKRKSDDAKEALDKSSIPIDRLRFSADEYETYVVACKDYDYAYSEYINAHTTLNSLKKKVDAAKALYHTAHERVVALDTTTNYWAIKTAMDISYEAYLVYMDALNIYTHALEE